MVQYMLAALLCSNRSRRLHKSSKRYTTPHETDYQLLGPKLTNGGLFFLFFI